MASDSAFAKLLLTVHAQLLFTGWPVYTTVVPQKHVAVHVHKTLSTQRGYYFKWESTKYDIIMQDYLVDINREHTKVTVQN